MKGAGSPLFHILVEFAGVQGTQETVVVLSSRRMSWRRAPRFMARSLAPGYWILSLRAMRAELTGTGHIAINKFGKVENRPLFVMNLQDCCPKEIVGNW